MLSVGLARGACAMLFAVSVALPGRAAAQEPVGEVSAPAFLPDSASPFAKIEVDADEAAKLEMPKLEFAETSGDVENFDKYYYFHRANVSYADAYRDIVECDGYARGLQSTIGYTYVNPYPFTGVLPGMVGSAIGSALADAIHGSAEKRRVRRTNMRQCMNFKGYQRYGLKKDLWAEFNFEEGLSAISDKRRFHHLKRQALVAANAKPAGKDLGL